MDFNYNAAATDAVFFIAVVGVFGLIFLFGAVMGTEYHTLGELPWQSRYGALAGANLIMWGATLAMMILKHVTLSELWEAAFAWKNMPTGPFGWAAFVVMMAIFCSPIFSAYAIVSIELQRRREERQSISIRTW